MLGDGLGHGGIPCRAVGVIGDPHREGRDPGSTSALEALDAVAVGPDGHHARRESGLRGRVEECL